MSKRRPRFTSSFDRARDAAFNFVVRPLKWFSPSTQFGLGFVLLVVATTFLLTNAYSRSAVEDYKEGEVVRRTVISPADIPVVDMTEMSRRKALARESSRPIFRYDPQRSAAAEQSFRALWDELRREVEMRGSGKKDFKWPGEVVAQENEDATRTNVARAIIERRFADAELDRLTRLLRESIEGFIYHDRDEQHLTQEITLFDVNNPGTPITIEMPKSRMTALSVAQQKLRSRVQQLSNWTPEQQSAIASALLPLVRPNVYFDEPATTAMREAAAAKVEPIVIDLKRNQVVAREGDTVSAHMQAQFTGIRNYARTARRWHNLIGLFFIVAALYWVAWKFTEHRSTTLSLALSKKKAFALVGSAVIVQTILMRVGFILGDNLSIQGMRPPFNDPTIWNFAIPFAAASLLVALLVDTQLALITALLTAIFAGMLAPTGVLKTLYAIISCSTAIYGIGRYRERQSVTIAGLLVGAVNALMAVALIAYAQQPLTLNTIMMAMGCGLLGGLLTTIFTAGGLPINESMFGILTDVKLLELSNADLPVLGQLALRAPGTNQHSHAVGQLAEEACRAVGANPLLARIGALYHDIGKLAAPDYFVENQQGYNPHDKLRPSNSARIITSHVSYGLKLAKEIGLPKKISDFIPQHHGTRTLHFFLRKAQAQAATEDEVDEAEFRYPGPKPQFKETAIMMIADSCEAAARSLAHPNPENISTIVSKIVDAIISDGQLDECDLSLRELTAIRESVTTSLVAIYHARIDYPGFNPPPLTGSLPALPLPHPGLDSEERGVSYNKTSEIPINKGGEVEDEAFTRKQ
ncbi:MAG TPA: HDIG domain-containing protein [Pyrinomonadaceae bacterium]